MEVRDAVAARLNERWGEVTAHYIPELHDPTTVRYEQRVAAGLATINGLSIEPKESTVEIGKKLLGFRVDRTVQSIRAAIGAAP